MFPSKITTISSKSFTSSANVYSLVFDGGNEYISLGNVLHVTADPRTWSFWFKTASTDTQTIMGDRNNNDGGHVIQLGATNIQYYRSDSNADEVGDPAQAQGTAFYTTFTSGDYQDNAWHHAVLVRGGIGINRIYLDGISRTLAADTEVLTTPAGSPRTDHVIGRQYESSAFKRYMNGSLDEIAMYDRALAADEVNILFGDGTPQSAGDANNISNLIGWWRLETGTGADAFDSSASGNDGSLQNTPTWTAY